MKVERLTRRDCRISRLWDVNDNAERVVLFVPTNARNRGPARHSHQSALVVASGCAAQANGAAARPICLRSPQPLNLGLSHPHPGAPLALGFR